MHRGSTVIFDRLTDARDDWRGDGYAYGLYGTPTTRELAIRVAELEGARASFVVPGGQAAVLGLATIHPGKRAAPLFRFR